MNGGIIDLRDASQLSETISACRSCGSAEIDVFLDLGRTALADRLLTETTVHSLELTFPLQAAFCSGCGLVQITETVKPEILFADDYPYFSSFSPALLKHSKDNVEGVIQRQGLSKGDFVIELASNDGYLLKNYVEHGIEVLGIDPAEGPARAAEEIGVPTLLDFFTLKLADDLVGKGIKADVLHGNNVLAHVADTNGFVAGIRRVLKDDGVAVIEAPYLKPLIEHTEFDTIYHEHLCYFSVTALDTLFRRHGLYLNEIQHLDIHGGSLRLFVEPFEAVTPSVSDQLAIERREGMHGLEFFRGFGRKVEDLKAQLVDLLTDLKADGGSIAAYGAAAKGATMIQFCDIGPDLIDFVVDRNVHKQGKYMPGKHIPILPPEELERRQPDYVLLLAWNFADEIMAQQQDYRDKGGKFIVPVPKPAIIG